MILPISVCQWKRVFLYEYRKVNSLKLDMYKLWMIRDMVELMGCMMDSWLGWVLS